MGRNACTTTDRERAARSWPNLMEYVKPCSCHVVTWHSFGRLQCNRMSIINHCHHFPFHCDYNFENMKRKSSEQFAWNDVELNDDDDDDYDDDDDADDEKIGSHFVSIWIGCKNVSARFMQVHRPLSRMEIYSPIVITNCLVKKYEQMCFVLTPYSFFTQALFLPLSLSPHLDLTFAFSLSVWLSVTSMVFSQEDLATFQCDITFIPSRHTENKNPKTNPKRNAIHNQKAELMAKHFEIFGAPPLVYPSKFHDFVRILFSLAFYLSVRSKSACDSTSESFSIRTFSLARWTIVICFYWARSEARRWEAEEGK